MDPLSRTQYFSKIKIRFSQSHESLQINIKISYYFNRILSKFFIQTL